MEKFIKENWFKLGILLIVLLVAFSFFYYFVILSNQKEARIQEQIKKEEQLKEQAQLEEKQIESQKSIEEALVKQQKEKSDILINKCISDAYTELKTLQANFDWIAVDFCKNNSSNCDFDFWNKAKDDAFVTYKEEWVPQCKLGRRVFIDYELYK